ncbi:MAG: CDP-alcohol phosphatidyltransferase family protein [Olsenella sp.]|nr:CDP-alcohol phosphatidyltransferase family protein [Olsenella sp.]MCI1646017.1 CDP-alcohol phosphatidyltransferase family protein [Olsenella sp.]MCI1667658.1 CDP-alcohol phosphatidyltransferase family protein [Olsenella sp.]MCI1793333.1 CDP-alcohol phosphatidyltransferase family protein [Olsenella sp.]MCI1810376.1 CDP-alcohol phosphatidyltransferase family protein [Olsenella sp.]
MSKKLESLGSQIRSVTDANAESAQRAGTTTAPVGTPDNPSFKILTVANVITACRLALTIAFLVLFVQRTDRVLALYFYAIAAVTDFLDGQIARRTQTVSWLGKVMDPIMDRVLLFTGVLAIMLTGELPVWVAILVIGRDCYLAVGALILQKYRRRPVDVAYIGKLTTALLMFGFCDLLLGAPVVPGLGIFDVAWLPGLNAQSAAVGIFFVYAGLICSMTTAVIYTREGLQIRREALAEQEGGKDK